MVNNNSILSKPYSIVFEQFFDNASFLWELHSVALKQPHYSPANLIELKARIDSNLNGLLKTTKDIWPLCESMLEHAGPGDTFVSAMIAFSEQNQIRIKAVVDNALTRTENKAALISALTWLPQKLSQPWLEALILSKDLEHKHLAIELCSALRKDPKDYLKTILTREDCSKNSALTCSTLRLIGELKRNDLSGILIEKINSDDTNIAFWASWSLLLLSDNKMKQSQALNHLQVAALKSGPLQAIAVELIFRVLPAEPAQAMINDIATAKKQRTVIKAVAILGDPHAIPWLISLMEQTQWAKIAAEAFTAITGVDLEENQLSIEPDDNNLAYLNDLNDDVAMDEDENLPWPDTKKLAAFWEINNHRFQVGSHYFMGQLHTKTLFINYIKNGNQRHRHAAALHLALMEPFEPFINTHIQVQ